jgi:hypothetical protein
MENFKGEEKKKKEGKFYPIQEEKEGKECPNCHSINDPEIKFCADCGHDFSVRRQCPKCSAKIISPNADICEVCGEWLLEEKCKFCYADIKEGQLYCSECGNPVAGIVCSQCGRLSYFDFCKFCNSPLTATAQKMIEKVKETPEVQIKKFSSNQEARTYFMAQKHLMVSKEIEDAEQKKSDELLKMKVYIEKAEKGEKKKKTFVPLFSDKQKESIKSIDKIVDKEIKRQEEERRRQEEERRRQEEEMRKRRPRGWLCNAYNALHPGGPNECADPSQGGTGFKEQ